MVFYLLASVGLAVIWMVVTSQFNPGGFVVGYLISLATFMVLRPNPRAVRWGRLPWQGLAAIRYVLTLFRDIFLSSIDVARRALAPDMRLRPGIIAVPTRDPAQREIVAALSAHSITITPGELVVDFDEDNRTLYVHCLDVDASRPGAAAAQAVRLRQFRDLLGDES